MWDKFPNQGLNLRPLHCNEDSELLDHQGSLSGEYFSPTIILYSFSFISSAPFTIMTCCLTAEFHTVKIMMPFEALKPTTGCYKHLGIKSESKSLLALAEGISWLSGIARDNFSVSLDQLFCDDNVFNWCYSLHHWFTSSPLRWLKSSVEIPNSCAVTLTDLLAAFVLGNYPEFYLKSNCLPLLFPTRSSRCRWAFFRHLRMQKHKPQYI